MELFVFAVILVAYLVYVGVTKWSTLQDHLYIVWVLMGLHLVGVTLYALLR